MRVGIVGLGLMGGSLGLALKEIKYITSVVGSDHNKIHQDEALEYKLVDDIVDKSVILECDIIILSIPVDGIITFLNSIKSLKSNQIIIDFGSTKEKIVQNTPNHIRANFIPAHPMTGTEKFGPTAAFKSLYKNKNIVLCDLNECGIFQKNTTLKLFKDLNMNIIEMDSSSHDNHAAFISHMPHIVSFALANSVMKQKEKEAILSLSAGGFRDMSRIAKSSPHMWSDIFEQNRKNVLDSIEYFEYELKKAKQMVSEQNLDKLKEWMSEANELHNILD